MKFCLQVFKHILNEKTSLAKKRGAKVVRINAGMSKYNDRRVRVCHVNKISKSLYFFAEGTIILPLKRSNRMRIIRCCGRNSCLVKKRRPHSKRNSTGQEDAATPVDSTNKVFTDIIFFDKNNMTRC